MDSALPGNTISHYRIVSKIGEGGMGTVYEAEDTRLHRTVALKFLSPGYTGESESARRFVREARTASALDHPNICTIYDVDETEDGHLFIVMAHYTGQTLKELLQHGPLEVNQAVDYAVQIGEGLAAAHARGIVHRDLKPANIFITDENLVKILDFGVAKLTGTPDVTRNGVLIGTPHYMAPEQITGQTVDQRADIWALGVIVYEMLCGKQPFCGEHEQSVIYSILEKEPKSINFQKTCIPESTFYCINRMLQKQPDDRPDSCKSIIRILSNHQFPDLINFEKNRRKSEVEWPRVTASIVFFTIIVIILISFTDMSSFSSNPAPNRIMILDFENQTNDAALDPLGRMAAGWIRQGLVGTGFLEVVDEPTTFTVQKYFKEEAISGIVSQSKNVGNETGAELLVTGAYYLYNDTIQMHAQISDTRSGDLFLALNPVEHHRDRISEIVKTIQQSTMTALASHVDPRLGRHEGTLDFPPNYSAYQNYLAGVENFYNDRFPQAAQSFERAVSLDSNFYHAFLWAGKSHLLVANRMVFPDNETEIRRHLKRVDEIIHLLIESKNELSEYERHHLDFLIARREGDFEGVYQAAIKMMKAAPGSQEAIREAATNAGRTCRHKIALSLWEELDPERGLMRSFGENYYHYYTFELHFAGKHRREYAVAKKGRILHPEPWKMWFLETRALVALGHVNRAVEIIDEAEFVLDRMGYLWLLWWTAHELYIHGPADQKFVLLERFSDSFQDYMIWLEVHEQERLRPFRETFIRVLFYLDKFEEAHDLLNELLIEYGDSSYLQWISGVIAAQRGEIALARSISDELAVSLPDSLYRQKYGSNFGRRAGIAAWLGEFDEAVYLLKKSYYRREPEAPCRDLMLRPLWGYQAFEGMIKGIDTEYIY